MPPRTEHQPGEPAPHDGHFEALNVFGTPTGDSVHMRRGEPLPPLPLGHSWSPARREDDE